MQRKLNKQSLLTMLGAVVLSGILMSSSHREAPMIADDPLADNTDVYAFRSPCSINTSNLKPGNCFITIESNKVIATQPFVKE